MCRTIREKRDVKCGSPWRLGLERKGCELSARTVAGGEEMEGTNRDGRRCLPLDKIHKVRRLVIAEDRDGTLKQVITKTSAEDVAGILGMWSTIRRVQGAVLDDGHPVAYIPKVIGAADRGPLCEAAGK